MSLKLFPPSRLQAVRVCAVIADRLKNEDFDAIVGELTEEVLAARPRSHPAIRNYIDDVIRLEGKGVTRKAISRWLSNCYPSARLSAQESEDIVVASGQEGWIGPLEAGWLGYEVGEEIRDNTEFDEWWYEWNGELDDAFFEWLQENFGGSSDWQPDLDFDFA